MCWYMYFLILLANENWNIKELRQVSKWDIIPSVCTSHVCNRHKQETKERKGQLCCIVILNLTVAVLNRELSYQVYYLPVYPAISKTTYFRALIWKYMDVNKNQDF